MNDLKIHHEECEINKRRLVLVFSVKESGHKNIEQGGSTYDGTVKPDVCRTYRFEHDHWDDGYSKMTIDGIEIKPHDPEEGLIRPWFDVLNAWKYNLQVAINDVGKSAEMLFIDRRHEHSDTFDVYYYGKRHVVKAKKIERPA